MLMKPLLYTFVIFCLTCAAPSFAVIIDDKNWRQVSETTGLDYNQMASACSVSTGICDGSVNGVDLSGWIWADADAVRSMFLTVTGAPATTFDPLQNIYIVRGATWADDFIDIDGDGEDTGLFDSTLAFSADDFVVFGVTRSLVLDVSDRSYIRLKYDDVLGDVNAAIVGNPVPFDAGRSHTGHWLYQAVPVPASLPLLLIGLLLMRFSRR